MRTTATHCGGQAAAETSRSTARPRLTYDELDAAANRVARFLVRGLRIQPGDRVGLLFDDAVDGYICMLAVLKVHAVYVPMDPGFPADRISYIAADAGVRTVLSHSRLAGLVAKPGPEVVYVDQAATIAAEKGERLTVVDTGAPLDDLCYVIYTSGTTGRPKGVAVSHPSICNFVRVAVETYGYTAADRVYQGLTMAFDFAIEETWVPWLSGATLVPKPRGPRREPARPRPGQLPARTAHLRAVLRPHTAGHAGRRGPARAAVPARLGGSLPARARGPLAPARQAVPERLRPHGGHRVGDVDAA